MHPTAEELRRAFDSRENLDRILLERVLGELKVALNQDEAERKETLTALEALHADILTEEKLARTGDSKAVPEEILEFCRHVYADMTIPEMRDSIAQGERLLAELAQDAL